MTPYPNVKTARPRLLRDGLVFMGKLWLDSLKDLTLSILALVAIVIDLARAGRQEPHLFQRVMQYGQRFDQWLDLYGPYDPSKLLPKRKQDRL